MKFNAQKKGPVGYSLRELDDLELVAAWLIDLAQSAHQSSCRPVRNRTYVSTEVIFLQSFFELMLCLTGTKYQNRFCLTNPDPSTPILPVR